MLRSSIFTWMVAAVFVANNLNGNDLMSRSVRMDRIG